MSEAKKDRKRTFRVRYPLLGQRLTEALRGKGWGRQDLMRELVRHGAIEADAANPTEPASKGASHYWFTGKKRPEPEVLAVIAEILDKPVAYFIDPEYVDDLNERVAQRLIEIIAHVAREGGSLAEEAERLLGTRRLFNRQEHRFIQAGQPELMKGLQTLAPRPLAEMTPAEQCQHIADLVRGDDDAGDVPER